MSFLSPRLNMPLLAPAQAQKHVTHNEALALLDVLVQSGVIAADQTSPPAGVQVGDAYVVAPGATGDWAGQDGNLAVEQNGGWVFLDAQPGWRTWDASTNRLIVFNGTGWTPMVGSVDLVDGVGINASWDTTNRLVVSADAALFTGATAGHQVKINKTSTADTASLLYQTAYTGHAEMGLAGNDDFAIKVSPDGSTWTDAVAIDNTSGGVSVPSLSLPSGDLQATLDDLAHRVYGREFVTIGNGEITIGNARHIVISTEVAGVADSLEKINGGYDGQIITCREGVGSGNITYESDATGGNIQIASNASQTLTQLRDTITLFRDGNIWRVVSLER